MPTVNLFGPVDQLLGAEVGLGEVLVVEVVILALVLVNFVTRRLAHGKHTDQADDGAEAVQRWIPHELSNFVLVLATFYYTTLEQYAGIIMSMFVVGLFITDFFSFEARKVEARRDLAIDKPKAALVASLFVLAYAAYQVFFVFVKGPLGSVA